MKLCLNCRQMSSDRDLSGPALFCPHCGLSFGVRRCGKCKKKPTSPRDATHCVHCGGTNLTAATSYLNFGWLSVSLSCGLIYVLARWIVLPLLGFFGASLNGLGKSIHAVFMVTLDRVLFWIFFAVLLSAFLSFLPKHLVEPWLKLAKALLKWGARAAGKTMSFGWRVLVWLWQRLTTPRRPL